MRRFRYTVAGLVMGLSVITSTITSASLVNAEELASTTEVNDYDEEFIEEQQIVSKYDSVADDALVKDYIEDHNLLDLLTAKYNVSNSNNVVADNLTKKQLVSLVSGGKELVINDPTFNSNIKSIKGLGLLGQASKIDISNLQITEIPDKEFQDCEGIKSFILPATVTKIGADAFSGCTSLEDINIPSGLTYLGESAFLNCSSLKKINNDNSLPASLKNVGQKAFANDISLSNIIIPSYEPGNLLENSTGLFYGCKGLSSITISDSITVIPASAFELAGTVEGSDGVNINFPKKLNRIKSNAFANVKFSYSAAQKVIDFSDMTDLTNIESGAFMNVKNIETVILPNAKSLSFGDYAFANISSSGDEPSSLKYMYVKGSDEETSAGTKPSYIFLPDFVNSIGDGCFYGNSQLKSVSLSPNLSEIPDYAFDDCIILDEVEQRKDSSNNCKVKLIGDAAFRKTAIIDTEFLMNMNNLTDIGRQIIDSGYTFEKGVKTKESDATSESKIASIPLGGIGDTNFVKDANGKKTYKNTPCGSEVFSYCPNLKSVHIPASVTTIASRAFYYYVPHDNYKKNKDGSEIKSVIEKIEWESADSPKNDVVRSISCGAFQGNINVNSVILPDNQGESFTIGRFAFAYDRSVKNFTFGKDSANVISNTVTKIEAGAFCNCESLESIVVQNTAKNECPELGNMIFWSCTKLKSAVLPASITEIPDHLFYNDPLQSFKIGNGADITDVGDTSGQNITKIGDLAFLGNMFETIDISGYIRLNEIGGGAFAFEDMLKEDSFEGKNAKIAYPSHGADSHLKKVILPEKIEGENPTLFINSAEFAGHVKFDTMKTPSYKDEHVIYIPDYMDLHEGRGLFADTGVSKTVWQADSTHNHEWKEIPVLIYMDCKNIEKAEDVLPQGDYVEGIGEGAFLSSLIKSADLSRFKNLNKLGTGNAALLGHPNPGVFEDCDALNKVILPKTNSEEGFVVGKNCFALSDSLSEVNLGSVKELQTGLCFQ